MYDIERLRDLLRAAQNTGAYLTSHEVKHLLGLFELYDETQRILEMPPVISLPWKPHEGEPRITPEQAMARYRARESRALSRTVMTDEEREAYIGDGKGLG